MPQTNLFTFQKSYDKDYNDASGTRMELAQCPGQSYITQQVMINTYATINIVPIASRRRITLIWEDRDEVWEKMACDCGLSCKF